MCCMYFNAPTIGSLFAHTDISGPPYTRKLDQLVPKGCKEDFVKQRIAVHVLSRLGTVC